MNNIDQILSDNYEQLDTLKNELVKLKEIKNNIDKLIGSNNQLPIIFEEKFSKIIEITNSYTKTLNDSVTLFVDGNNELLAKNNINLGDKIIQLDTEISRLVAIDFNLLFKDLETKFLENSKTELAKELVKFDEKADDFQSKNDELGIEITRLSEIDLEKHFDRHQNKLSEIFNAINSINSALSNISSNINKIIQNLGDIEQTLSKNHRENNGNFDLIKQNQANDKKELLTKIDESNVILNALIAQNELLKKDLNLNKKISFGIIGLLIIAVIVIKYI